MLPSHLGSSCKITRFASLLLSRRCSSAMTSEASVYLQPMLVTSRAGGAQLLWHGGMGPAGLRAPPILPSEVPLGESFVANLLARSPRMRALLVEGPDWFPISVGLFGCNSVTAEGMPLRIDGLWFNRPQPRAPCWRFGAHQ